MEEDGGESRHARHMHDLHHTITHTFSSGSSFSTAYFSAMFSSMLPCRPLIGQKNRGRALVLICVRSMVVPLARQSATSVSCRWTTDRETEREKDTKARTLILAKAFVMPAV